jgi:hypothetical protein
MAETAHGPPRACWGSPAVNATHAKQAAEGALLKPLAGDRMEDDHDDEEGQPDRWAKEPHDGHRKAVERHADHRAQALGPEVLRSGGRLQQLRGMVKSCGRRVLIDYAATLVSASSGRSMSTPFPNLAPARTRATRCGPLT